MVEKRVLSPDRERRVPRQFSWVDQRLVRDGYIERCPALAWGLYLFLVAVGDSRGLSYWSDESICRRLSLSVDVLRRLRGELEAADVAVYRAPLYQVLSLPPAPSSGKRGGGMFSVVEVLRRVSGAARP